MAPFHTIASQTVKVTICKHITQIIKKIAKLNIGYCSTIFRIESQKHSTVEYCKRKIQYMRQTPRAKLRLHVYKQVGFRVFRVGFRCSGWVPGVPGGVPAFTDTHFENDFLENPPLILRPS
jgi:hypothetical protein